jgi:lipoate-protein ligase A
VETPATTGARNMATDVVLAESVREGGVPVLRFYRWWPPCISLGRNQPAKGQYDLAEAERRKIEFVRRPTGGRAVYHHHEITYSVAVRDRQLGGPRRTYELIHKALHAGLRLLGAPTEIAPDPGRPIRPSTLPCFTALDGGAIVAGHRKLVGSAMLREGGVLLQHGSLLLTQDQGPTVKLLHVQRPEDFPDEITALDVLLAHLPTWTELVDGLASGFERLLGIHLVESTLSEEENLRVTEVTRRFADPDWTWRL